MAFGTDPVVGVTPIANMLDELKRPLRSTPSRRFTSIETQKHNSVQRRPKPTQKSRRSHGAGRSSSRDHTSNAWRLYRSVADMLGKEFLKLGLVPTQAGGTAPSNKGAPARTCLEVRSRFNLRQVISRSAASEPLPTFGKKGRVLGFGHPMMNAGQVNLPVAVAKVLHVLVSDQRSFKIFRGSTTAGKPGPRSAGCDRRRHPNQTLTNPSSRRCAGRTGRSQNQMGCKSPPTTLHSPR